MGLDQFLYYKKWLFHFEDKKDREVEPLEINGLKLEPKEIMYEVYYWRKSNHIHKWFVENIQNGNDDCGTYEVEWEQLEELLNIINQILGCGKDNKKNILAGLNPKDIAKELLPTASGFFFGGTEYDDYYFDDLKETKEMLEKLIKNKEKLNDGEFYYSSSW
jgi:hypothetical protein